MTNNEPTLSKMKEYSYSLDLEGDGTAAKTLRLVGNGKKVLELGCSVGTQSRILTEKLGCDVTGVELNPMAAHQAKAYCSRVVVGNLDQIDFETEFHDQKFNVILCADVLEHIYDPIAMLSKVKSVISSNGYVVASIPNIVHIALIFEMLQGRFDYRDIGLLDESHIRFFTRSTLIRTFSEAGFKLEHLERGLVGPFDTEFKIVANTSEDHAILDYLRTHNEECFTYHFIVKALPSDAPLAEIQQHNAEFGLSELDLSNVSMIARDKEKQIEQLQEQVSRLLSQVDWLEKKFIFRLAKSIKFFLRF
jgi:2-polyprenyl-3-methyl-5-hydroxy-6-metoxy-1,4-benzoquinol methylase/translation elongation factor EF-1beta